MRKTLLLLATGLLYQVCAAQTIKRLDGTTISAEKLTQRIHYLMDNAHVQGVAIAVFNQNKAVYKHAFGYKRLDKKDTLTSYTNIYGASLSKSVFAVMVMKLVEEGQLDLDKPLVQYLDKPVYDYPTKYKWQDDYSSLKGDTLHQQITARMCLDHTTSFLNWRWVEPDQKLHIHYKPGTRYAYSGEGMTFLQNVIEKKSGKTLDELMAEKVFKPLGMKNSAYQFEARFDKDYAMGHQSDGKLYEKDKDNEPRAPSTLETTLDDLSLFLAGVMQNKVLKPATTKAMFTPQIRIRSARQFGPLSTRDTSIYDGIQLSYGLGWGMLKSPYGWGAFKEGHGDGFQHYMIVFPDKQIGILIMTNSDNGESIYKDLLETAIADVYTPWEWNDNTPWDMKK